MKQVSFSKITGSHGIFVDGDWVESKDQDPTGDVRLIQLADIGDGIFIDKSRRYLTAEKAKELRCTFLEPGDLLIARMPDPLGRACIFPKIEMPCVTVVDVCIVRPDKNIVSSEWLKLLVNSEEFRKRINKYITGTTRQRISRGNLEKLKFNIPSLEDQSRIVKIIDQADSLRQKRKQAIMFLDDYLKSVFLEMFGDPIKNTKKWQMVKLDKVLKHIKYGTSTPPLYSSTGKRFIRATNIKNGEISEKEMRLITEKEALKIDKCRLTTGDFIIVRSGVNTGDSVVVNEKYDGDYAGYDLIVRFNEMVNPHFIGQMFLSSYLEKVIKPLTRRAAQPHINSDQVKELKVILPPKIVQDKFAIMVDKTNLIKQKMIEQYEELENQFHALMQKAFNGNL